MWFVLWYACLTLISLCSHQTQIMNMFLGAVLLVATPHQHRATRRLRISTRQLTAKMTAIVHEDLSHYLIIGARCSAYVRTRDVSGVVCPADQVWIARTQR